MEFVDLSNSRSFARGFPHDFFTWLRRHEPGAVARTDSIYPQRRGFLGRQPL